MLLNDASAAPAANTPTAGGPEVALETVAVSKRYGSQIALAGLSLTARHGEVHGLLGPNGAGKTTLMRVVLGLVRPDAGVVRVLGQTVEAGAGVPTGVAGFVETPAFYPYLSGLENLELLAMLDDACPGKPGELLERAGLGGHAERKVAGYSAGMRQRLGLAAALLRAPRLLLLDEPTTSLDPAAANAFRDEVRRLAQAGTSVVLSSHDMAEVEDLCATLTVVREGRVIFTGSAAELRALEGPAVHRLQTSDDSAALAFAESVAGVRVCRSDEAGALDVTAAPDALDAFVVALARAGIAVRRLEPRRRSLESLFLQITGKGS